jgi:hypothetical protein
MKKEHPEQAPKIEEDFQLGKYLNKKITAFSRFRLNQLIYVGPIFLPMLVDALGRTLNAREFERCTNDGVEITLAECIELNGDSKFVTPASATPFYFQLILVLMLTAIFYYLIRSCKFCWYMARYRILVDSTFHKRSAQFKLLLLLTLIVFVICSWPMTDNFSKTIKYSEKSFLFWEKKHTLIMYFTTSNTESLATKLVPFVAMIWVYLDKVISMGLLMDNPFLYLTDIKELLMEPDGKELMHKFAKMEWQCDIGRVENEISSGRWFACFPFGLFKDYNALAGPLEIKQLKEKGLIYPF